MQGERQIFVGRSTEIALGDRAIARGLAGEGTLLLLSGPAGVGKTRLAQTIAALGEARGAKVVWGRAWESGGAPPYWPWLQVFRALGVSEEVFTADASVGDIEVSQARFAKFDRAARQLTSAAASEGIIIALDDLHAADSASLHFLQFLARNLYSARLLIVVTYRELEAKLDGDRATLLAKISREGTIADQLAAAVGLGGRDRKAGSNAQRVRINVQRRIRDATKRIASHDPALGRYLDATVSTGMFCMFLPV